MQLRTARLCLDCEELHEDQQCPVCASEEFAFLTRWVPVTERRVRRRPPAQQSHMASRVVKGASISLALVAAQWLWSRWAAPPKSSAPKATRAEDSTASK
jgi:hypothetical protein